MFEKVERRVLGRDVSLNLPRTIGVSPHCSRSRVSHVGVPTGQDKTGRIECCYPTLFCAPWASLFLRGSTRNCNVPLPPPSLVLHSLTVFRHGLLSHFPPSIYIPWPQQFLILRHYCYMAL